MLWRCLTDRFQRGRSARHAKARHFEVLEDRRLLAADLISESVTDESALVSTWSSAPIIKTVFAEEGKGDASAQGHGGGPHGTLTGIKFEDRNGNGVQDFDPDPNLDEKGIAGWEIYLDTNRNGILDDGERTEETDGNGEYVFSNLAPGNYTIGEVLQQGWAQTFPDRREIGEVFRILGSTTNAFLNTPSLLDLRVNSADGIPHAESPIAPMPIATGMAQSPVTGVLYSVTKMRDEFGDRIPTLNIVDPSTGELAPVGAVVEIIDEQTTESVELAGLAFSPSGVLYGLSFPGPALYTIDTEPAEAETIYATLVGFIDAEQNISGISFDADGRLYGANEFIMEIDPGTAELIGLPVPLGEDVFLFDIAFAPDGTAYGYSQTAAGITSAVVSLDPLTGDVTVLGQSKYLIGSMDADLLGVWSVTVEAGDAIVNNNFGNRRLGDILGTSWNDLNFDGIRDPNEPGLPGVKVYLDLDNDNELDPGEPRMTTLDDDLNTLEVDESGSYSFVDLLADTYSIREVVPQNYVSTPFPSSDPVISVSLSPGEISTDNDFGNVLLPEIEGTKFADVNGDGIWDVNEPGIPGAVFYLDLNDNGRLDGTLDTTSSVTLSIPITDDSVVTTSLDVVGLIGTVQDLNVTLSIDHPAADDLDVFLISPNGTRVELFSDVGVEGANFTGTTLDDQAVTSISTGTAPFSDSFQPLGQLSDFNSEIPSGIWTLEVTDDTNNGLTGTIISWSLTMLVDLPISEPIAVSGADGKFRFVGLDPDLGPYTVREVVSEGYVQTAPASGSYASIEVTYGDIIQDNDFGNQPLAQIQGTKWLDLNLNGLQDTDEPVLPGWTIYLDLNESGTLDEDEPTVVTDDNGDYAFTNLPTGEYVVAQVVPASWQQTFPPELPPAAMEAGHDVKEVATLEQLLDAITTTGAKGSTYVSGKPFRPGKKPGNDGATSNTAESRGLIKVDEFHATERFGGVYGNGYSTVIIDTGFDLDHPFFGPDSDGDGIADRIVFQYDFAHDDNDASATNGSGHGSNIASIVGSQDGNFTGVAPGVNIIALKVFNDTGGAPFSAIEKALQWVVANAEEFNILSVNMSLGDELNHTAETTESANGIDDELAALAGPGGLGVIVVNSAGNNFHAFNSVPGVSYPAADPNTLAVGAVWDADVGQVFFSAGDKNFSTGPDRITSFSQRHEDLLDIFAPGAPINGAGLDGGVSTFYGTSQAAPHIAAVAVLAQQIAIEQLGRRLTMEEFSGLLKSSGVTVYDGDENHNGEVDGDEEDDNVINTELEFQRVDALALADAILDMATGKTLGDGTWTVMVAPGDLHTEVDFAGFTTFDFGDAPDSYPTLLADNGANHVIVGSGPILGSVIDSEADANVSASADGDDVTATDDEDGVQFTTLIGQGELASVNVVASGAGLVSAWIDFNHDADWDDAGEQILTDANVVGGVNELQFDVPNGATVGATFARFRIATESGLAPTGPALDGEVEDYKVLITEGDGILGDVDFSGALDAADIDLLYANFGSSDPVFDLTNDAVVNQLDVDFLVRTLIGTEYGDANLDKVVDIEDFGFVFGNFGTTSVGWADGSFNGDDIVDIEDFGFVFGNFGFDAAMGPVFATEAFVANASVRSDEISLADEAAEDEDESDQQSLSPPEEGVARGVSTASVRRLARHIAAS